jgi:hypothetical protein
VIAVLKTNILLSSQQQISIIMSINGVIQNAKWPELVLTEASGGAKVDGENFVKSDNQRVRGS